MANILGVIPARMQSVRLPGKPLQDIGGKSLLQRVWEQAKKASKISELVIATDSPQILSAAASFGAQALLTSPSHASGSDRVAEVCRKYQESRPFELVVNIQGDMPFIHPRLIDLTIEALLHAPQFGMSTVATAILEQAEFLRPSVVKVVFGTEQRALYFSRSPIPFMRDAAQSAQQLLGYKHLGLYVYRPQALLTLSSLPPSPLETRESLEQLRALEGGIAIKVVIASPSLVAYQVEVDTADDLERARTIAAQCAIF